MRNWRFTDECECKDVLTEVENFGQLALEVSEVGLEAVALPHFDGKKVVVVLFGLPARGILSEKCFGYLLESMERI